MSKEFILPLDTIIVEDKTSKLTVCTYEDGTKTSEIAFFDNPNKPGEVMLRGLVITGIGDETSDCSETTRYLYTQRVAKLAVAQFNETGSTELLHALKG